MHKRDYVAIADTIESNGDLFKSNIAHLTFALSVGLMLAEDNSRFDMARFLNACMPKWTVGTRYSNVWERAIAINS